MLSWHSAPHSASSEVVAELSRLELSAATQLVSLAGQARPGLLTAPHFLLVVGKGNGGIVFPPPDKMLFLNNDLLAADSRSTGRPVCLDIQPPASNQDKPDTLYMVYGHSKTKCTHTNRWYPLM